MTSTYGSDTISNIILFVLAAMVILVAAGCIFAFVRAIFFFIFSQGKEEKIKKAWNSIRYMVIGILLTVVLLYLFPLVFRRIGIENYERYTAKNIFSKAGTILNNIFELKDVFKETQDLNRYDGQLYTPTNTDTSRGSDYTL